MWCDVEQPLIKSINLIRGIAFDIGLRNLGMALLEWKEDERRMVSIKLDLIDLNTHITNEAIENLYDKLEENRSKGLFENLKFAGIEQQPERQHVGRFGGGARDNTQMKSISHAIQMYFLCYLIPVKFISPRSKWNVYKGPEIPLKTKSKVKYTIGKEKAVNQCFAMLDQNRDLPGNLYIRQLTKKDDVADAYLLCYYGLQAFIK